MRSLKRGEYAPVYFLEGEEPYYIDAVADYIENNVLDEMAREFDLTILYGKDIQNLASVINAAKSFPMMGDKSVIIVREAQNISSWNDIVFYMEHPQPTTILVFCYKNGTLRADTKAFKSINEKGIVLKSEPLRDYQVAPWITQYCKDKGVSIAPDAVQMLAEHLGTDLTKIINELDKLVIGRPEGVNMITSELVERNVEISKDYNILELRKAIVAYDIVKVNRIVYYYAANQKKNPIQSVVATLFNFFSGLMLYHYLPDKSSAMAVAQQLKTTQYTAGEYMAAARFYSALQTMKIISYLREMDARSKGIGDSNSDPLHLYQELVYKMMHRIV